VPEVIEGPDAQEIARGVELPFRSVPDREREVAQDPIRRPVAPRPIGAQDSFGIRRAGQSVTVVDAPVEGHNESAVVVGFGSRGEEGTVVERNGPRDATHDASSPAVEFYFSAWSSPLSVSCRIRLSRSSRRRGSSASYSSLSLATVFSLFPVSKRRFHMRVP